MHHLKLVKKTPQRVVQATPPSLFTCIKGTHTIRFLNTSGTAQTLAPGTNDWCDMMFVATSATTGYRLFDAIRIRRIQMWWSASSGTQSSVAAVEDIALTFVAGLGAPSRTRLNAQPSPGENGYLDYKPPKGSIQNGWLSTSITTTNNLLRLIIPPNATVDMTFEYTLADGVDNPTPVSRTVAAAVTGQVYVSRFMNQLIPQGVAQI